MCPSSHIPCWSVRHTCQRTSLHCTASAPRPASAGAEGALRGTDSPFAARVAPALPHAAPPLPPCALAVALASPYAAPALPHAALPHAAPPPACAAPSVALPPSRSAPLSPGATCAGPPLVPLPPADAPVRRSLRRRRTPTDVLPLALPALHALHILCVVAGGLGGAHTVGALDPGAACGTPHLHPRTGPVAPAQVVHLVHLLLDPEILFGSPHFHSDTDPARCHIGFAGLAHLVLDHNISFDTPRSHLRTDLARSDIHSVHSDTDFGTDLAHSHICSALDAPALVPPLLALGISSVPPARPALDDQSASYGTPRFPVDTDPARSEIRSAGPAHAAAAARLPLGPGTPHGILRSHPAPVEPDHLLSVAKQMA
mmetsp:Transcript_53959/g.89022  ORF Transcript_53959/g.89022 Transcript_53959/m.89022 type:complete len:372 (+) Transcript_53959:250-1365(+)